MSNVKTIAYAKFLYIGLFVLFLAGAVLVGFAQAVEDEKPAWLDTTLPVEKRVADLLSRMTLAEKVSQMVDKATAIERLGIPKYQWWNECLHGVMAEGATVFPQAIGLASTWDPQLIGETAVAISDEARVIHRRGTSDRRAGGLTYWSPVVNIARDPRWGRTQETYGEDPYLVSRIATSFVKGLQGDDPKYLKLVATPKHFVANNEEGRRHGGSSDVDEQLLWEYYLAAFRNCVVQGKAYSVMCAYNALNDMPCCADKWLLEDVLRRQWGFEGYVVSDCGAVRDFYSGHHYSTSGPEAAAAAIKAGSDLNCGRVYKSHLLSAVKNRLLTEEEIDKSLGRLLKARFLLGMFDPAEMVSYNKVPDNMFGCEKHKQLALKTARESIVLLKNEKGLLPLNKSKIKSIAVVGPNAEVAQFGNYSGTPTVAVSPLEGIRNKTGADVNVDYVKGCEVAEFVPIGTEYLIPADAQPGQTGLKAEYFNSNNLFGNPVLVRVDKMIDFDWGNSSPELSVSRYDFTVRWTGKLIAPVSGQCQLALIKQRRARLYIDGKMVVDQWEGGRGGTNILALNLTKGRQYDIRIEYRGGNRGTNFRQSFVTLGWDVVKDQTMLQRIKEAADLAQKADVAIVFAGIDQSIEAESNDRSCTDLPSCQVELIKQVYKANPKTVVVLINGSPLSVRWIAENIPAVVEAWYPGQEGGTAIAEVLFGDYNPAGRLPMTFYASVEQLPPFNDYDIRKGRTYMYLKDKPLYPFGHGLSYTKFKYSRLKIVSKKFGKSGKINVSVKVKNTGRYNGDEVVQLYIRDVQSSVQRPLKQLRRFKRIHLKKGEKKTVSFVLTQEDLSYYDVSSGRFVVEPGEFEIMVGSSSDDIRLKRSFGVKNSN